MILKPGILLNKSNQIDLANQMKKKVYVEKAWRIICSNFKGKLLDIGCGRGFVSYNYGDVVGLDFQENNSLIPLVKGDATKLPFRDNSFDTVLMSHVLEHFLESEEVLKECHRVLKQDAGIIISVPNLDTFSAKLFGKRYGYVFNPEHKQFFNIKKLKKDVSKYFFVEKNFGTTPTFPYTDSLMELKPFRNLWWKLGDLDKEHTRDIIIIAKKK